MARASTDFNAKPQVVLRHLQEPNPPVLHATSHSGGTTFPRKQRSHRFQLSLQFKNKMFLKASLVRQICQSLAAKRFTSKLKSWMLKRCMPALDWRIEKPRASAAEPHVHASNRQSPLFFTPFHALSPASLGCGARLLVRSPETAQRLRWCHCCGPTASHLEPRRPSRPHHTSNLRAHAPQQHPETRRGTRNPQHGCQFGRPAQGGPNAGASPILCLAPWSPLLRAAYELTGRNTGKQLAPSEPAVPHQGSTQVHVPPFPSRHPHL